MLRILRQLTPEETRQAAMYCGARPGATPEEIIRCLSRLCGATTWGLFPATTDDVLLDQAGRRLGMPPLVGGPRALTARERAIFACYFRQAWDGATEDRQYAALQQALDFWDSPALPRPALPEEVDDETHLHPVLESLLQHSTGCRALATAAETVPLPLPSPGIPVGPIRVVGSRAAVGHQALYGVLLVLWRARGRILRERRLQRTQLERQLRQLESLATIRRRNLNETPVRWGLNPASGLSVATAAAMSMAVHLAMAAASPATLVPAAMVGAAGLAWSVSAAILGPRGASDARVAQMQAQAQSFRYQLMQIERETLALETE
jgi:hypothetical protein